MMHRAGLIAAVCCLSANVGVAQAPVPQDSTRCDSIVGAARVDSVHMGLFVTVGRVDRVELPPERGEIIGTAVASVFTPPKPLRVRVFDGPVRTRLLRRLTSDTTPELRAPSVIGVYRYTSTPTKAIAHIETVRASLIPGFDSAATSAIVAASIIKDVVEVSPDEDSIRVEVRLSSDSIAGSRRFANLTFPRMPVVNAVVFRDNPAPKFPAGATDTIGEVVLRFVVDKMGMPRSETLELARGHSMTFVRAAFEAFDAQLFAPATIRGCPVAQLVYYPFTFAMPLSGIPPSRH